MSHLTLLVALPLGIFPVYPPGEYTGKIPIAGKYTKYFPGGAFDLSGYYDTMFAISGYCWLSVVIVGY